MKQLNRRFYHDPAHGWLAVKFKDLCELGITDSISCFSYMRGQTAYLEQDSDAGKYLEAARERGLEIQIQDRQHHTVSPIRYYERYDADVVRDRMILKNLTLTNKQDSISA